MFEMTKTSLVLFASAMAVALGMTGEPAHAADCKTATKKDDITQAEANTLYDCIQASLIEGYLKAPDVPGVTDFRNWKLVTTAPLVSSTHGGMFVNHWINETGAALYTKYDSTDGETYPVGTIAAKESFRVTKKGEVKRGPLFLMEKVADSAVPDGWVYTRLFPNGKYQRTNGPKSEKMAFCHECHAATIDQFDAMFFPPEEHRVQ